MPRRKSEEHTFEARVAATRAQLEQDMAAQGMTAQDGWTIQEEVRETVDGKMYFLRPSHPAQPTPPGYVAAIKMFD